MIDKEPNKCSTQCAQREKGRALHNSFVNNKYYMNHFIRDNKLEELVLHRCMRSERERKRQRVRAKAKNELRAPSITIELS